MKIDLEVGSKCHFCTHPWICLSNSMIDSWLVLTDMTTININVVVLASRIFFDSLVSLRLKFTLGLLLSSFSRLFSASFIARNRRKFKITRETQGMKWTNIARNLEKTTKTFLIKISKLDGFDTFQKTSMGFFPFHNVNCNLKENKIIFFISSHLIFQWLISTVINPLIGCNRRSLPWSAT